jgi:hypothetical protein
MTGKSSLFVTVEPRGGDSLSPALTATILPDYSSLLWEMKSSLRYEGERISPMAGKAREAPSTC